jgi:hypothetical protein
MAPPPQKCFQHPSYNWNHALSWNIVFPHGLMYIKSCRIMYYRKYQRMTGIEPKRQNWKPDKLMYRLKEAVVEEEVVALSTSHTPRKLWLTEWYPALLLLWKSINKITNAKPVTFWPCQLPFQKQSVQTNLLRWFKGQYAPIKRYHQ